MHAESGGSSWHVDGGLVFIGQFLHHIYHIRHNRPGITDA